MRRFDVHGRSISFNIREPPAGENPVLWLEESIRDIHAYITTLVPPNALIGVSIRSDRFARGPGGLSFRPIENFSYLDLWNLISSISQSNAVLGVDDTLALQIYYVEMPVGAGRAKRPLGIGAARKRSIVTIQNEDALCLPRALVVARAHLAYKTNECSDAYKVWRVISDGRRKLQKERAVKLVADAGVILPLGVWIPRVDGISKFFCCGGYCDSYIR